MIRLSERDLGEGVAMEEAFQAARILQERGWEVEYAGPEEGRDERLGEIPPEVLREALRDAMKRIGENS